MSWLKKHVRIIIIAALAAILTLSLVMTALQQAQYRANAQANEEAAAIAGLPSAQEKMSGESPPPESVPPDQPDPAAIPTAAANLAALNLAALREVNPDVTGWIEIPGTELSYPVVQSADNHYYLDHNWKQDANRGGSIFLESTNRADFTDFHTIVYGHRMRDGSMFGSLRHYKEQSYWQEHPNIYVAAENRVYRYAIFSAHESGVRDLTYRLDLVESGLQGEFLQYCADESVINAGGAPEDSRILTLSTCTGNGYRTRWVVHGYLAETWEP